MTMADTQTSNTVARIVACLAAADYAALVDLCAPDVLLDMNVPRGGSYWQSRRVGDLGATRLHRR
jgi:hypothetical protein